MTPTRTLAALTLTALALAGCTTDSTDTVCTDLARHIDGGQRSDERMGTLDSMAGVIANADPAVQEGHAALVRTADGPQTAWDLALDTTAQACLDAGWNG